MPKPSILIDTNALTHLASVSSDLNGKSVDKWLWGIFNIHTCTAVRDEFRVGIANAPLPNLKAMAIVVSGRITGTKTELRAFRTCATPQLWNRAGCIRGTMPSPCPRGRGERHLLCAAAELACHGTIGKFIVVTDDNTALRKFIRPVLKDHPLAEVWSTLDLLLFMYLTRKEVTAGFAKDAVRDIAGAS